MKLALILALAAIGCGYSEAEMQLHRDRIEALQRDVEQCHEAK